MIEEREWKKDEDTDEGFEEFDPLGYVEEDREVLEKLAQIRLAREDRDFPAHLLITDELWAREVTRKATAEKQGGKTVPPHPEPEVRGREVLDEEVLPRSVKGVVKMLAESGGWSWRLTYARGSLPGRWARVDKADEQTSWVTRVVESHMVRAENGVSEFAATWVDGKTNVVFWVEDVAAVDWVGLKAKKVSMTELKKKLVEVGKGHGDVQLEVSYDL